MIWKMVVLLHLSFQGRWNICRSPPNKYMSFKKKRDLRKGTKLLTAQMKKHIELHTWCYLKIKAWKLLEGRDLSYSDIFWVERQLSNEFWISSPTSISLKYNTIMTGQSGRARQSSVRRDQCYTRWPPWEQTSTTAILTQVERASENRQWCCQIFIVIDQDSYFYIQIC